MAWLVKRLTLDFSLGLDLWIVSLSPVFGLHAGCGTYLKKKVQNSNYIFIHLNQNYLCDRQGIFFIINLP